jgi:antitoxin MazE
MKVGLIRIGNSRGIRIPKPLIEQCRLGDTVEMHIEQNRLVITPERSARKEWRKSFATAGAVTDEDPLLLDPLTPNTFDDEEWTW